MAGDGDAARAGEPVEAKSADGSTTADETAVFSPTLKIWTFVVGLLLVLWFFIAWLALDRHVLDAAGESVGTAFALGLVLSVIGAVRSSRD